MENQPKLNNSKEIIAYLATKFPLCFIVEGEAKPLKIGIFQDLATRLQDDPLVSKTQLRTALRLYTSSWRYLHGIRLGAERVDLDGQLCGALDQEHVEHARKQLEEAKAKVKATRSAAQPKNKKNETVKTRAAKATPSLVAKKVTKPKEPQEIKPKQPPAKSAMQPTAAGLKDLSALKVGQAVKVLVGKNATEATVLEIAKDGVRIQIPSGLAMVVRAEHLAI